MSSAKSDEKGGAPEGLRWTDVRELCVEGKGFTDTERFFDRLPARAKGTVPEPVWQLSHNSSGMAVRFVTDATAIRARWQLRKEQLALAHMPASGASGLDLYVKEGGAWHSVGIGQARQFPDNEDPLAEGLDAAEREYALYLPLYNGVESVEIGVAAGVSLRAAPARAAGAIVFYGTSIVQGGCASRCGMAYPAIIGRRLDRPTINLGFSGNGRMEKEVAEFLAELDPAAYVLDALPNMAEPLVAEHVAPFVRTLREARPETPIVLVENISYEQAAFVAARRERCTSVNAAHRRAYEGLLAEGVSNLTYVPGDDLLGRDGEATVDGTHPTDVGFLRIADVLTPVLQTLV